MITRRFINQASSLVIARILKDVISFFLMLWLARIDQAGFGLLSFAMGLSFLVLALLDLGLDQYLLREFSKSQRSPLELLNTLLRIRAILGLGVNLALAGFLIGQGYEPIPLVLILGVCLSRVMETCAETLLTVYRARGRQVLEAQLSSTALIVGAGYGTLLLLLGQGPGAMVQFLVLYSGLRLALAAILGRRAGLLTGVTLRPVSPLGLTVLKSHGAGLLVLAAIYLCGTFFNRIQPLFLKYYQGLTEVALFGSAYDLSGGVLSIISLLILGRVVFPHLVAARAQDRSQFQAMAGTHLKWLVLIGTALTFFFYLRGGALVIFIYGAEYAQATLPVQTLAWALIPSLINNYLVLVWLAESRYRLLVWGHVLAALSSLVLGFILVPALGPQGAALNLLISRAIMTLMFLVAAQISYGLVFSAANLRALAGPVFLVGAYLALKEWDFLWAVRISLSLFGLWLGWTFYRQEVKKKD